MRFVIRRKEEDRGGQGPYHLVWAHGSLLIPVNEWTEQFPEIQLQNLIESNVENLHGPVTINHSIN